MLEDSKDGKLWIKLNETRQCPEIDGMFHISVTVRNGISTDSELTRIALETPEVTAKVNRVNHMAFEIFSES